MEFLKSLYNIYEIKSITPERVQTIIKMCHREHRILFITRKQNDINKLIFWYQRIWYPHINFFIFHKDNYHFGNFDLIFRRVLVLLKVISNALFVLTQ